MNDPLQPEERNELISKALRGGLSEKEDARLRELFEADPSVQIQLQEEKQLEQILQILPDVPVATNFTTLVLQAVGREGRVKERARFRIPVFRSAFARVATGLAVVLLVGVVFQQNHRESKQAELAQTVSTFSEVASAINQTERPEQLFQDFDAIQRLSLPSDSELDLELLVALQK